MSGSFALDYLTGILTVIGVIVGLIWLWINHNFNYWKRYNIPYIKPHPLFGNIKEIITMSSNPAEHFQKLYNDKIAINQPAIGIYLFNTPALLLRDPELIKTVLIKDFNQFSDHYALCDPHSDPIGFAHLFFAKNPLWKQIRSKLSPTFTASKIRQMFPLMKEIGQQLDQHLCLLPVNPRTNANIQEVKEICALFTTDVIGSVAYGVIANSLKNPNGDFRTNGKRIFDFTKFRTLELNTMFFFPYIARLMRFKLFSKQTANFLRNTISYIIEDREKSGINRNDFIDFLVSLKRGTVPDKENIKANFKFDLDALTGLAGVFFTAGFESTSATISFALFELSRRSDLQKRLREEIHQNLRENNGDITYDMVDKMPFLDQVIHETLRMYPSQPFIDRECTLSNNDRSYSLEPFLNFNIPHGMPVIIPVYAFQRDPKYFLNPDEFNPDRFDPGSGYTAPSLGYTPFGIGPRICIGERLGLVQSKIGIINFLRNHYVTSCEKSHTEMKLASSVVLQSDDGIYLNIVRDPFI